MSLPSTGAIRPTCPNTFDLYVLNRALTTVDAVSCLLDTLIRDTGSLSSEKLSILADSLRQAAADIDPTTVKGVRHG